MSSSSREGFLAVCATFTGLCTIAVGLRFYARKRQNLAVRTDDWFALIALVSFIGAATIAFVSVSNKFLGYSSSIHADPEATRAFKSAPSYQTQIALVIISTSTLAFIKLSALFFYRRVFVTKVLVEAFDIALWTTIVVVVLWLFVFDFLIGFQCGTHFSALWNGTYLQYCTLSFPSLYGIAISDFLLDVWILILPIPRIMKLHVSTTKKLSILGIFLLAFAGLGASIARMVQWIQIELAGPQYFLSHDEQRAETQALFFAMLEAGLSLVAVNLPSLWPLAASMEPQKLLQSVRSWVSLPRSRSSAEYTEKGSPTRNASYESQMPLPTFVNDDVESQRFSAYASHDVRGVAFEQSQPTKSIRVDSTVEVK